MDTAADRLARVARKRTCRLTHIGRRSGRRFEVTIWFMADGDHLYLTTMKMQRNWTRNVQANGRIVLRVGSETFDGEASVVTDPGEMARVVELLGKKYWLARPYLWVKKRPDGAFRVRLTA